MWWEELANLENQVVTKPSAATTVTPGGGATGPPSRFAMIWLIASRDTSPSADRALPALSTSLPCLSYFGACPVAFCCSSFLASSRKEMESLMSCPWPAAMANFNFF